MTLVCRDQMRISALVQEAMVNRPEKPWLCLRVSSANTNRICALATVKIRCANRDYYPLLAHVEAGLRSFDWHMPEEYNRRLTDAVSDFLFTTEPSGARNLEHEGIDRKRIFFVGNVMIDSLLRFKKRAEHSDILERLKLDAGRYALLTMHRPSNVDERRALGGLLHVLKRITKLLDVVYPIHPRTEKMLKQYGLSADFLKIVPPLGYLDFVKLMMNARCVLTDSGGIQEETTVLEIPCLTLRNNTERPVTVSEGTNTIVGKDPEKIFHTVETILKGKMKKGKRPKLWDGKAARRICRTIDAHLRNP
jgi:UDP-N-acetylglucosamine 2-epimerase (non-hydrolysing)